MPRPPLKPLSLTIFFPCHNEEANVERVTLAALEVGRRVADELEVIIVNDGSRDRTGAIAERLAAQHREVRVVHNRVNLGYGGALRAGFGAAGKRWVFYTDGDGQFDLNELPGLLPLLERYDIVSCYRLGRRDPLLRRFNAWAWTLLVNRLLGLRLRDIDCAFKLFPRELFERIALSSRGALIDAEVLAKAQRLGYSIGQKGVRHYRRVAGQQSGANLRVIARAFKELFKLRRQMGGAGRAA